MVVKDAPPYSSPKHTIHGHGLHTTMHDACLAAARVGWGWGGVRWYVCSSREKRPPPPSFPPLHLSTFSYVHHAHPTYVRETDRVRKAVSCSCFQACNSLARISFCYRNYAHATGGRILCLNAPSTGLIFSVPRAYSAPRWPSSPPLRSPQRPPLAGLATATPSPRSHFSASSHRLPWCSIRSSTPLSSTTCPPTLHLPRTTALLRNLRATRRTARADG